MVSFFIGCNVTAVCAVAELLVVIFQVAFRFVKLMNICSLYNMAIAHDRLLGNVLFIFITVFQVIYPNLD